MSSAQQALSVCTRVALLRSVCGVDSFGGNRRPQVTLHQGPDGGPNYNAASSTVTVEPEPGSTLYDVKRQACDSFKVLGNCRGWPLHDDVSC